MKYSELKTLARSYAPQATIEQIPDTSMELILRQGALDVAMRLFCLKTNDKFDADEDARSYRMSAVLERYLTIDKSGLWWKNGDDYVKLNPVTIAWLDENRPNWRTEESGEPVYYALDSDEVYVVPPSDEDVSDGFWAYFAQIPPTPSNDDHYPFGGATEITHLAPLSECILYYWKWKALGIIGKSDEMDKFKPNYLAEIEDKGRFLRTRMDISNSRDTKLKGPMIR